ncbi:MAG: CPBP family intramembrane metalloprotease [Lachnospiraceae bacterium]|nr:CPBP family intramembrane metalloprotease [Lachnospiraceae bacterium]
MQTEKDNRISAVNIVFLVSILISVVVAFLPLDFLTGRPALQLVFSQVVLVLPSVVFMLVHKIPYREAVRFRKMKFADMALCILLGILIQPVMTLINALSMVFATNTTSTFMLELSEQIPFLGAVVLMALVPCILEETVYRGVFYNEYSKINPWKAALLSGFLFGLMHGNINQFCYAAVMGIIFALVIEATGSILSTMLIHFWINAGSVAMIYLYPKLYEVMQAFYRMYKEYGNEEMAAQLELSMGDMTLSSREWMQQMFETSEALPLTVPDVLLVYGPMAGIAGVLAFLVYRKLARRNGNWEKICGFFGRKQSEAAGMAATLEVQPKQRMVTIPLVLGIVVGIAFMVFYEIVIRLSA